MRVPSKEEVKEYSRSALKWIAYVTAALFWLGQVISFAADKWPF